MLPIEPRLSLAVLVGNIPTDFYMQCIDFYLQCVDFGMQCYQ